MAVTRSADGTSRPRKFPEYDATAPTKARAGKKPAAVAAKAKKAATDVTKKTKSVAAKANTSAVRAKQEKAKGGKAKEDKEKGSKDKVVKGRVEKKVAPKKTPVKNKRDTTVLDKLEGVVEKVVGVVQGKPGKKAAGTKKIRGTDGKGSKRGAKA